MKRLNLVVLSLAMVLASCGGGGRLNPDNSGAQLSFGIQMAKRGLWSEALFRFQQADKMAPGDPKTLNNLAVAYEAVGRFDDALAYYQKALKASPSARDLKKNYARFVEFYQGFKPDGPDDSAGASETTEDVENSDSGRA